jgi:hypothetical protein
MDLRHIASDAKVSLVEGWDLDRDTLANPHETCTFAAFCRANAEWRLNHLLEIWQEIHNGDGAMVGGGASPCFTLMLERKRKAMLRRLA